MRAYLLMSIFPNDLNCFLVVVLIQALVHQRIGIGKMLELGICQMAILLELLQLFVPFVPLFICVLQFLYKQIHSDLIP